MINSVRKEEGVQTTPSFCFKKKLYVILSMYCFFAISCTKVVPFEFDAINNSLVVNSIFKPEQPFWFNFSSTSSPVDSYRILTDDFKFSLYENDILLIDTIINSESLQTNYYPKVNKQYTIRVQTSDNKEVFSIDSIPQLVRINRATIKIPAGIDEYGDKYAEAQVSFTDPPGEKNYYELLIYSLRNNEIGSYWICDGDCNIVDPVLLNEGDKNYYPTSCFFSDELFDGEEYTMRVQSVGGGYGQKSGVTLRSVSENYYLYRKYYTRHFNNQQFQGDFLDLVFMGEVQPMFNNIINGYGIFVGYQETSAILKEER